MSGLSKLTSTLAEKLGMSDQNGQELIQTLKATAFKGDVSDAQMTALLVVANQYGLNPWTKEIYAFPDRQNGIVPVVGVDGWSRIINQNPQFNGMEFRASETMVEMNGARPAPEWMECVIYRKDRDHPVVIREYLDEVYREPFKPGMKGPWQTHTKRFFRHKAMIQCSRLAFGYVGIYDQDEAERVVDMGTVQRAPEQEAARPALEHYPAEQFEANFPAWKNAIEAGKRTPEQIVAMVSSKAELTNEQRAQIMALEEGVEA
ncbi:MAG TPA: phage recombination protein Bet [Marinobacter hydrocarbonoclasticus]|uniref:Phage recombination protein Bet n=1 Tax=Marinobacter nauticus TaxID=2743 RepID=A0A3B8WNI8_MARNT|nr:phage recombination protein Bet [Marinobacter nauticus]HIC14310.1 phage recombination protein Bet [Gemmatimonadota bacterium]